MTGSILHITEATDTTPPSIPTGLTATPVSETEIDLAWNASTDTQTGVSAYRLYDGAVQIAQLTTLSYKHTGLAVYSQHSYTVSAVDGVGNESVQSAAVASRSLDQTAPTVPTGLAGNAASDTEIDLNWAASTDASSGVAGYRVFRDGAQIAQVATVSYQDKGVASFSQHSYTLAAVDNSGNVSAQCAPVVVRSLDLTAPTVPTGLVGNPVSSTEIDLTWGASTDTGSGIKFYNVYRGGALVAQSSILSLNDQGLAAGTQYSYQISAVDNSNNESAKTAALLVTTQGTTGTAPGAATALWGGYQDTVSVQFSWWGPPEQIDFNWTNYLDHYKVWWDAGTGGAFSVLYGNNIPHLAGETDAAWIARGGLGCLPDQGYGGGGKPEPWYVANNLSPNTTYRFYVTTINSAGLESAPSAILTMKTLANGPSQYPAPPIDARTWIRPYTPPTGTKWICTDLTINDVAGTGTPGPGQTVTGCSLKHAFANCNINGGDQFVLTPVGAAGLNTYATPGTGQPAGWQIPDFTGTNGDTTIIVSTAPELGTGGAFIPYTDDPSSRVLEAFTLTASLNIGDTVAHLQGTTWTRKTGVYWIRTSNFEKRRALFTQGSNVVDWSGYNALVGPGLTKTGTTLLRVAYTSGVTPYDRQNMAVVKYGTANSNAFNIGTAAKNLRIVGVWFEALNGITNSGYGVLFQNSQWQSFKASCDHVYLDRCAFGTDPEIAANFGWMPHAFGPVNCDHFLMHQCFTWGCITPGGADSNIFVIGGGPMCFRQSQIECASESIMCGGGYVDKNQIPHDIQWYGNVSTKPDYYENTTLLGTSIRNQVKNLFELKCAIRAECWGNLHWGCKSEGQQGYHGAAFAIGARDQSEQFAISTAPSSVCPWQTVQDFNAHHNQCIEVETAFVSFTGDVNPACYTARARFAQNQIWISTVNRNFQDRGALFRQTGPCVDHIIEHNTQIADSSSQTQFLTAGLYWINPGPHFASPMPYSPNAISGGDSATTNLVGDRMTIRANVFGTAASSGYAVFALGSPPLTWGRNLTIVDNVTLNDPATYTTGWLANHVPYASMGFRNWSGSDTDPPVNANDWDVVSGLYATTSDGQPIGATYSPNPKTAQSLFDYSGGFASAGSELSLRPNGTKSGSDVQLFVPNTQHQGGALWRTAQIPIDAFDTTFTFQLPAGNPVPSCIGFHFCIHNTNSSAVGGTAFWGSGGGGVNGGGVTNDANTKGYGAFWYPNAFTNQWGCPLSMAIKFDQDIYQMAPWNPLLGGAPNSIALFANGGPSAAMIPQDDLTPSGVNFYSGNIMSARFVYDGALLTLTLRDTVTGAQCRRSWPFDLVRILGSEVGWVGFMAGTAATQTPVTNTSLLIKSWTYSRGCNPRLYAPTFSVPAGQYTAAQSVAITAAPGATIYYTTNGQAPTTSSAQYSGPISISASTFLQAIAVQSGFNDSLIASANYLIQAAGQPTINFPNFNNAANLLSCVGCTGIQAPNLSLIPTGMPGAQALYYGAAWYVAPVDVSVPWSTTFNFNVATGNPTLTGFTFCIQGQVPGSDFKYNNAPMASNDGALRWSTGGILAMGGGNGYGWGGNTQNNQYAEQIGIMRSLAIKFDSGGGPNGNGTGLYINAPGQQNSTDPTQNTLTATGMAFQNGHNYQATIAYDGNGTITLTIKDLTSNPAPYVKTFTGVDIVGTVGGNKAIVGFTAGSYYSIRQTITSWTGF